MTAVQQPLTQGHGVQSWQAPALLGSMRHSASCNLIDVQALMRVTSAELQLH